MSQNRRLLRTAAPMNPRLAKAPATLNGGCSSGTANPRRPTAVHARRRGRACQAVCDLRCLFGWLSPRSPQSLRGHSAGAAWAPGAAAAAAEGARPVVRSDGSGSATRRPTTSRPFRGRAHGHAGELLGAGATGRDAEQGGRGLQHVHRPLVRPVSDGDDHGQLGAARYLRAILAQDGNLQAAVFPCHPTQATLSAVITSGSCEWPITSAVGMPSEAANTASWGPSASARGSLAARPRRRWTVVLPGCLDVR